MIRVAVPADVPDIVRLVKELADYERAADEVRLTEDSLTAALFADAPAVFCDVAVDDQSGAVIGMSLWFVSYSTWMGSHGIYLEDLYVSPEHRRGGHGRALLETLARRAIERGYARLEWAVLDWNEPALDFYRTIGAVGQDEWTVHRVSGPALAELAGPQHP